MKKLFILLLILLSTVAYGQSGDFDILTGGVSVASKTVDLRTASQIAGAGSLTAAFMAQYLDLNTTTGTPDYNAGRLYYDMSEGVLAFMPIFDGPILQVGQENWMWAYNNTGSTITNGQAVCICSAIAGTVPTVTLAQANSVAGARPIAIATMDVANNSYGFFTTAGKCNSLNTSMFSAGDCLYLSASTPGSLTNVIPVSPYYIVEIGSVVTSSSTNGSIYVRIAPCGALCPAVFADDVEVKGSVTLSANEQILQNDEVAFSAMGITSGNSYTSTFAMPGGNTSYYIVLSTTTGSNSALGAYSAIVTYTGTSFMVTEITDVGNAYTLTVDGSRHIVVTNNHSSTLYSRFQARRNN